ncbi:basic-leucine zipper transcription factor-like protein [Pseudohyphozyma bogoriensis]|nr:basic-leucine zipper transcription factor-like protein [Pseudohyphozyma bogoriensis]
MASPLQLAPSTEISGSAVPTLSVPPREFLEALAASVPSGEAAAESGSAPAAEAKKNLGMEMFDPDIVYGRTPDYQVNDPPDLPVASTSTSNTNLTSTNGGGARIEEIVYGVGGEAARAEDDGPGEGVAGAEPKGKGKGTGRKRKKTSEDVVEVGEGANGDLATTAGASGSGEEEALVSADGNKVLKNTKRAAQNRAAQRAFRERKEAHVKELEARLLQIPSLESEIASLKHRLSLFELPTVAPSEREAWDMERKAWEITKGEWKAREEAWNRQTVEWATRERALMGEVEKLKQGKSGN